MLAGLAVLLVVVALFGLRETLPVERRRPATVRASLASYRSLLRDRVFVALTFIGGSMMAAMFAYVSGASFVLQDGFGLDARTFGLVFGLNAAGLTLTAQLNPVLLRWFTVRQVLSGAIVGAMVSSAVLLVVGLTGFGGLLGVLVPLAVLVATAGLALPNTPALALTRHGEAAGTAAAVLGCVQFGVGGVVAPLVGAFGTTTATPMGGVMLGVTSFAALLMFGVSPGRSGSNDLWSRRSARAGCRRARRAGWSRRSCARSPSGPCGRRRRQAGRPARRRCRRRGRPRRSPRSPAGSPPAPPRWSDRRGTSMPKSHSSSSCRPATWWPNQ